MGSETTGPERSRPKDPAPQLAQLKVPSDASLPALGRFTVMEFRASSYWHRMRERANVLCEALDYQPFPVSSRWNPLTTTGAGFYLHVIITALWTTSLFIRFVPPR